MSLLALHSVVTLSLLAAAASGQQGKTPEARPVTDADRTAILTTLGLKGDPRGQVMNECDELWLLSFCRWSSVAG